ncbi:MAG: hypothetical protein JWN37_349 [Candidatus Nomurabacteria bacterium]|nr:hypothetical protein [Candidatus Nomurabacteria bacterium]
MEIFFTPSVILLATIAGYILGGIWYSPLLFFRWSLEAEGLTVETNPRRGRSYKTKVLLYTLIITGILASSLALILDIANPSSLKDALYLSLLISVGIIGATRLMDLMHSAIGTYNSGRNQKKFLVWSLYYIVMFAVMTIVMYYVR